MRYLIDNNTLSDSLLKKSIGREDVFVLDDVVDEYVFSPEDVLKIKSVGIKILEVNKKHLEMAIKILEDHGDNLKLIRLYTNEGRGDIMMLAYILAEREKPETLFTEEYTLVTRDKELTRVAKIYGIRCLEKL